MFNSSVICFQWFEYLFKFGKNDIKITKKLQIYAEKLQQNEIDSAKELQRS